MKRVPATETEANKKGDMHSLKSFVKRQQESKHQKNLQQRVSCPKNYALPLNLPPLFRSNQKVNMKWTSGVVVVLSVVALMVATVVGVEEGCRIGDFKYPKDICDEVMKTLVGPQ